MLAVVFAVMLQQAAAGPVVWAETEPPPPPPVAAPALPAWARADPWGYERSECSPMIRKAEESQEACQARVRAELVADLGDALPAGMKGASASDGCRQEAAGDRYALQCGAPRRSGAPVTVTEERTCETRPQAQPSGGVAWSEECRPASGGRDQDEGLRIRLGGD